MRVANSTEKMDYTNADTNLKFNKKTHRYYIDDTELTSVTTFVSKFFPKFEAKKIAKKLSRFPKYKKKGKKPSDILKDWKELTQQGTNIHEALENEVLKKPTPKLSTAREQNKFNQGKKYLNKLNRDDIQTEIIVHSKKLGLAGTVDGLYFTKSGIVLLDWKTNKKIDMKGYGGKKAKEPISHLDDCKYIKYALQLSTYAYILQKEYGEYIAQLKIIHLTEDGYKVYRLPYLKKEIKAMLKHIKGE